MTYKTFSPKQKAAMFWWKMKRFKDHDGIICDGSIRSGKSLSMTVGFILWAMYNFNNENFAMCGKTIDSFRRNIGAPMKQWLEGLDLSITERISRNYFEVSACGKTNRFYMFGGRDESSAALIQGITLAGVLLDEVALMPRSFVEQALSRCSVEGSKFWFNCNPESPQHWFLLEWINKANEKNVLHLHFTMDDNYSLAPKIKARYENMYSGVFYDRFVRGLWVIAEGLVYPMFDQSKHVTSAIPEGGQYYISCDYGTLNPFSAGLWRVVSGKAYRISEYYYDGRKKAVQRTDEEHYKALEELAEGKPIERIIIDPSAASMIACIKRHGRFSVRHAKNDVISGIGRTASLIKGGRLLFSPNCKDSIREYGLYRWDEKAVEDKPLKQDDHAMDDIRYFVSTVLSREFKWVNWGGANV